MPRKATEGSVQFKFRVKDELRQKLEEAAEARGVSLNQEITERLGNSFNPLWTDKKKDNPTVDAIVDLLGQVIYAAGYSAGGRTFSTDGRSTWYDDPLAFDQVCKAVEVTLQAIKPPESASAFDLKQLGHLLPPDAAERLNHGFENIGEIAARVVLHEMTEIVGEPESKMPTERAERARRLRSALGHVADRIPK